MDASGESICRPEVGDPTMPTRPLLDFAAGYVRRVVDQLPRQGDRGPWCTSVDYRSDVELMRDGSVAHPELHFSRASAGAVPPLAAAVAA
jgi:hypothetical protein